jgi:CDP-paratose 2-epimerase
MRHLITGGAGFIGINLADTLLAQGESVTLFDNLSRPRTPLNLAWLQQRYGSRLSFIQADIRDAAAVNAAVDGHDVVYHLAGQVAVTTSVLDPRSDFEINALGTLNVLEAARQAARPPIVLFSSTNKVYGGMEEIGVVEEAARYRFSHQPYGISEAQPLDFHSPYGCSKGAADQYIRDYARIYGLRTVVFRQSCIYGERQFGVEDQGWAAHFAIAALLDKPITIYGNGKQVRDMLFVDDLVAAFQAAVTAIDRVSGQIFNIGGGPARSLSIWAEFGPLLSRLRGAPITVRYADWRPGDQPIYISDIRHAERLLGWQPRISTAVGIERMFNWIRNNLELFR